MEPVPTIPPLPPPAMPTLATPPSLGGSKPSRAGNRGGPGVQITPSSVQPEDMSLVLSSGIWFEEPVVTGSMTTDTAAQRSPLESPVLGPARRSHSAGTEQEESKALLVGSPSLAATLAGLDANPTEQSQPGRAGGQHPAPHRPPAQGHNVCQLW
ncbi:uncharacterized protein [Heliangelus exortis]|uniref:uncharacterized protein isoform X6 n=1 Tax=Heliangelus exortis TaxID=472823 RepID=UPI003A9293D6